MIKAIRILKIYPESFRANIYTANPFRMIGLIDVDIEYAYGVERVTLAFYRSSGTNGGKIQGLWYPIVGIKVKNGKFSEFSRDINIIMKNSTKQGKGKKGWLAKSIFFSKRIDGDYQKRGFSYGRHYGKLLYIGEVLSELYNKGKYINDNSLRAKEYNKILYSEEVKQGNKLSQKVNFDNFIKDIFEER